MPISFCFWKPQGIGANRRCSTRPTAKVPATRTVPVHRDSSELSHHRTSDASLICPSRSVRGYRPDSASRVVSHLRTLPQAVLCPCNGTYRVRNRRRSWRAAHSTRRRDHYFATTIPTDQVQTLDARRARALVARAPAGSDDLRSMVRAEGGVDNRGITPVSRNGVNECSENITKKIGSGSNEIFDLILPLARPAMPPPC
jgi:hypothetical protein